jgi:hypothetical protein
MGVSLSVQDLPALLTAIVGLVWVLVVLYTAVKAPPPAKALQWRGMTVSSHPGISVCIIIGIATIVTCILRWLGTYKF